MKEKTVRLITIAMLLFSLTACNSMEPLPGNIEIVGSAVPTEAPEQTAQPMQSHYPFPTENLDKPEASQPDAMTVDSVKSWYGDALSGQFQDGPESEKDGLRTETAGLGFGGGIDIVSYDGVYYSATFHITRDTQQEDIMEWATSCLKIYIGRGLTEIESGDLSNAIRVALSGSEIIYLTAFDGYLSGYLVADETTLYIQVS